MHCHLESCAVNLPCSRLVSVATYCALNSGPRSLARKCVIILKWFVICRLVLWLHLSLCGLYYPAEGIVAPCRRWKPCDSSRICVAVVNPSSLSPFSSGMQTWMSCAFLLPRLFSNENVMGTSLYEESCCM